MTILERLCQLEDKEYALFQAKLTPTVPADNFIGVRVPDARKLAKELMKEGDQTDFFRELPHKFFDENMLHGLMISEIKDYDECIKEVNLFLPYVDNWAVCDIMSPKIFKKNKEALLEEIRGWVKSEGSYTKRFGMEMLMTHFLDGNFREEYLEIPAVVRSTEYYVNMMTAWFFATALAKQWEKTIPYIECERLDKWTHNKAIQKARESNRITREQKEYLRTLKK